jgi:replicative superfamily II helicase
MSATMKNVDVLARWIGGHYYNCDFRPIPLCEFLVTNVFILLFCEVDIRTRSWILRTILFDN